MNRDAINSIHVRPGRASRWSAVLSVVLVSVLPAQVAQGPARIAELFAGEIEDVGPQFMLQETSAPARLEAWLDAEYAGTTNATYVETDRRSSTQLMAQGGVTWRGVRRPWLGGEAALEAGLRLQTYRYGLLDGHGKRIDFIEPARNDFNAVAPEVQGRWMRGAWSAAIALRASELRTAHGNRTFYRELAGDAQCYRAWSPRGSLAVATGLELARRWTRTDSYGILPVSWHDRAEIAAVVIAEQQLGAHWRVQPVARLQFANYTRSDRSRRDWLTSARLSLVRDWRGRWDTRLFVGYEHRKTSEALIANYTKWDLGSGANVRWRF